MTRRPDPRNLALQDRVSAVLADAHPEALTSAQIAETTGGKKTLSQRCFDGYVFQPGVVGRCRADDMGDEWNAVHHPGDPDIDSWEVPYNAMDIGPILRRLERGGYVRRALRPDSRAVYWTWTGPMPDRDITDLETMWALPERSHP